MVTDRSVISGEGALALIVAAQRAAAAEGIAVSICVLDPGGVQVGFLRMDGAALGTVHLATTKAHSAAMFGTPTHAWHGILAGSDVLREGLLGTERFTTLGGGVPLMSGGALVGALGVSGGSVEQDRGIAEAAAAEVVG
jgi:glc operon protein GlcG